ncbi:MAG: hypothetical protein R6X19_05400, partial [Kiritimatiellia bacterium]
WGLIKGGTVNGTFVRYYQDTLELRGDQGQIIPVDINTLSLEYIRYLIPTIAQDELDHPVQQLKGLSSSTKEREYLLKRARFIDTGRKNYGRLLAYNRGAYYFESTSGKIFRRDESTVSRIRGLSDYVRTCINQIPENLNDARLSGLIASWENEQRMVNLEHRVREAEQAAGEAQRLQHNNTPGNSQIPPGFRPYNGTWVSP